MKRIAYVDCQSGISGDMFLGALVDAGVSLKELEKHLSALPVRGYRLSTKRVRRKGFRATRVDVIIPQNTKYKIQNLKRWGDVKKTIEGSRLSSHIKQKGLKIFKRLFQAEVKVHGGALNSVHLHELGAVDCIVDVFGTLIGLDLLGIEEIYASPLNLGSCLIESAHGRIPAPAPATLELVRGIPVYSTGIPFELTTPTGAALITSLARRFGPIPLMAVSSTGIGAGSRELDEQPNILRIIVGESMGKEQDDVMVIETNIDDMTPQAYEYIMDKLFKAGALDVFLTNIIMKKGRPGVKLSVLCLRNDMEQMITLIFRETTTTGLRFYGAGRKVLKREIRKVETQFGKVGVKVSWLDDEMVRVSPEYSDCARIAKRHKRALLEIMKMVSSSFSLDGHKKGGAISED